MIYTPRNRKLCEFGREKRYIKCSIFKIRFHFRFPQKFRKSRARKVLFCISHLSPRVEFTFPVSVSSVTHSFAVPRSTWRMTINACALIPSVSPVIAYIRGAMRRWKPPAMYSDARDAVAAGGSRRKWNSSYARRTHSLRAIYSREDTRCEYRARRFTSVAGTRHVVVRCEGGGGSGREYSKKIEGGCEERG